MKLLEGFCAKNWTKTGPNHRAKTMFFPRTRKTPPSNPEIQHTIKPSKLAFFTSKT
jgi:hypothetical protein